MIPQPLGWVRNASLQPRGPRADFPGVARALLEAGAPIEGDDHQADDDVMEVLAEFRRRRP